MKAYKNNKAIEVMGVLFKGVKDMICHAIDNVSKDGVYVGIDDQRYPCFDSDDMRMRIDIIRTWCLPTVRKSLTRSWRD